MITVVDVETTGVDPAVDKVVELAAVYRSPNQLGCNWKSTLVNPGRPIPPEASAVHHIRDRDVAEAPALSGAWELINTPDEAWAAHNAAFDRGFLPPVEQPWICTWRCALHLYPEAPSHSNQCLRYYLGLDDEVRQHVQLATDGAPHRALYDALTTAVILMHMLKTHTVEQLVALSTQPVILTTVRFGKHRGAAWSSLPHDYLRWILRQDFDADVVCTARHYLGLT